MDMRRRPHPKTLNITALAHSDGRELLVQVQFQFSQNCILFLRGVGIFEAFENFLVIFVIRFDLHHTFTVRTS